MYTVILALHVFVCVLLILAVLLQNNKGGGLGAAFGGGTDSNVFGPGAPANIMNKITTAIAACFLVLSLVLALMSSDRTGDSILRDYQQQAPVSAPEEQ